ncbi:MAG: hypothetical protein LQ351_001461 [Letrouitia transgressa]|nr:MAG: hypothetical protein LQ351_001461 [Letrouitia transgressa]
MSVGFVIDQYGRFNVWAGNIGAQQRGSASLDYRLQDASHVKDQVIGQLKFLAQTTEDASSIFSGGKAPFEELLSSSESSESEISGSSASSADEALSLISTNFAPCEDSELPQTELLQLRQAISTFISNLYKISILIRRNPTPHDRLFKAAKIDISSYEPFDQQHV